MAHTLAAELPAPLTEALDRTSAAFARMPEATRRLAQEFVGADEVLFVVRTASRVDVGSWLGPGRLWALALRGALALVAHGPRPYTERIPFSRLRESTYNPVTGELVLAPPHHLRVRGLKLAPLEGYQMLAQIHG
ncbi:MAG TPA: hypothetical protein VNE39_00235 [Planctomycetota bacterium]|nr:hypothetical protein [Planctomycetota bacterium]